ncbi:hypothetical protein J5J10_17730 [Ciceribacter sp. L1K23]|uniref:hypothetical protein n=1 Tax=Ciceribacter sp. L1K23 TaxID=2820276 RepID=UPI001B83D951|nr:hypothetical protein [Ciceribacter sp. L1K23]MBR0557529.1 hypothetical protein [Ciceribacter sp. L1K23]
MLPPIQISQSGVAYQGRRSEEPELASSAKTALTGTTEAEATGLDLRSAIAGRVSILLLSGPERAAESFAIMAELIGRSLGIPRKEGETQIAFMKRLAEALNALPESKRQIVEQQLSQLFNGLALKTITSAFSDPSGPDAAIMTLHLEVADGDVDHRFARSSFQGYGIDADDTGLQPKAPGLITVAAANGNPAQLRILGVAAGPDIHEGLPGSNTPAAFATARPTIEIRGEGTDSSRFHAADYAPSAFRSVRSFSQVTIEINGRASNPSPSDHPAPLVNSTKSGDAKEKAVLPRDAATIADADWRSPPLATEKPARTLAPRREDTHIHGDAKTIGEPGPVPALSLLPVTGETADAEDPFSKFLRASLMSTSQATQTEGSELPEALRKEGNHSEKLAKATNSLFDVVADRQPAEKQNGEPGMIERVEKGAAAANNTDAMLQTAAPQRPGHEPIGYPVVGYPYLDDEEPEPRRLSKSVHDDEENSSGGGEQPSSGNDEPEEPFSESRDDEELSEDADGSKTDEAARATHLREPDSAHDLYWKMAGWA